MKFFNICRKCLNRQFGTDLHHSQCNYSYYPQQCHACGEVHHLVTKLRFTGRVKFLFRSRSTKQEK